MAFGTPSLFGDTGRPWYNLRSSDIVRFVQGGVVKTFRQLNQPIFPHVFWVKSLRLNRKAAVVPRLCQISPNI